jgi:Cys-tRNA(Pro)/Cys-tRNA(Cys) deacylase
MSTGTPATRALSQAGAAFRVLEYDYVSSSDRIGRQAAEAIGLDPGQVLKTLMVEVDGRPACAVIPSDRTLR